MKFEIVMAGFGFADLSLGLDLAACMAVIVCIEWAMLAWQTSR